jgi:hypothetical protein
MRTAAPRVGCSIPSCRRSVPSTSVTFHSGVGIICTHVPESTKDLKSCRKAHCPILWVVSNRTWPARFRRSAGHGSMRNCVGRLFLKVAGPPELPVLTLSWPWRAAASGRSFQARLLRHRPARCFERCPVRRVFERLVVFDERLLRLTLLHEHIAPPSPSAVTVRWRRRPSAS